jgi:transposase-like protein
VGNHARMNRSADPYTRHRFPPAVVQCAVRLYHRFNLRHRDIEDLLAEQWIEASYESVRLQGRNRTIDTRIFSRSRSAVRRADSSGMVLAQIAHDISRRFTEAA